MQNKFFLSNLLSEPGGQQPRIDFLSFTVSRKADSSVHFGEPFLKSALQNCKCVLPTQRLLYDESSTKFIQRSSLSNLHSLSIRGDRSLSPQGRNLWLTVIGLVRSDVRGKDSSLTKNDRIGRLTGRKQRSPGNV